jgi:hypothetical protein
VIFFDTKRKRQQRYDAAVVETDIVAFGVGDDEDAERIAGIIESAIVSISLGEFGQPPEILE